MSLLSPPYSYTAVKHGPCLVNYTKKKKKKKRRTQAFETKCMRKLLRIFYLEHKTSIWVWSKINFLVGPEECLLAIVKRRKLAWFGHVTRHDSLSKTILRGIFGGGRRCGRQKKRWMDNIKEWTFLSMPKLLTKASCRKEWKRISAESSLMSSRRPDRWRDWTELNWCCWSVRMLVSAKQLSAPW